MLKPFGLYVSFIFIILISNVVMASPDYKLDDLTITEEAFEIDKGNFQTLAPNDTAKILSNKAGVQARGGGVISSLPTIRGLSNDRVNIKIDQQTITASCPNHMNAALTYIDPEKIGSFEIQSSTSSVSSGADSLGSSILVKSKDALFSSTDSPISKLMMSTFYRNNNHNAGASIDAHVANQKWSFLYQGMDEKAGRYQDGHGDRLRGTIYNQNNQSLTIASKGHNSITKVKLSQAIGPYQGYVNQYMDMTNNAAYNAQLSYTKFYNNLEVDTNLSYFSVEHLMDKLQSERTGEMPMATSSREVNYNLKFKQSLSQVHSFHYGLELLRYTLNDWWDPVAGTGMSPNTYWSINDGKRDRTGLYLEDHKKWSNSLKTELGLRYDLVEMSTGKVQGYDSKLQADIDAFNASSREHTDHNWDFLAKSELTHSDMFKTIVAYSRKTRSPNLYERYAWAGTKTNLGAMGMPAMHGRMAARMINWYGDGNGYIGNQDLKAEIAQTLETTLVINDRKNESWLVKITPFVTYINDYIDVDVKASPASDGRNYLQFANHDAVITGFDIDSNFSLGKNSRLGQLDLLATLSYTRGYRVDSQDELYHMMPLNASFNLIQTTDRWKNFMGVQFVEAKRLVNSMRLEPTTAGFALINLGTTYKLTKRLTLDFSVSNLLDHFYQAPLAGVDVVNYEAKTQTPVAAMGRSLNTKLTLSF
jgi:iron complex outermembrane recepter protein